MYALLDAHNFYASAEIAMRPSLRNQAFVILGSNDGCVVARSELARTMGVKMGVPWFKLRDEQDQGLMALSANFELYSDFSLRMHSLLSGLAADVTPYSVDESFAYLGDMPGDHTQRVWRMRARVMQWLGLPMGAGIGTTRTLAKLASHISKQAFRKPGIYPARLAHVCNLGQCSPELLRDCMAATPVGEVWGVGRRYSDQLVQAGVVTALDLARMDTATARLRWGVVMERTIRELNGVSCITIQAAASKQQIMCSRSLAKGVGTTQELEKLGALFAANAASKMRLQNAMCGAVSVFVMTSPFRQGPRYARSLVVPLCQYTDDTRRIAQAATQGMRSIFASGFDLVKVGVMLVDLAQKEQALSQGQFDFSAERPSMKEHALMHALDAINAKYGKKCVRVAAEETARISHRERMTPCYTTSINDVPIVRA